ncbi:MAG: TetR/AcrR family transcriptional regulator [Gemmatimonadaceae bacterium]
MPTPRWRRRPEDRPQEIIEAGFRVFGAHGLSAARLDDVAKEAGVSKGTIYLYFDSKEALFREVVRAKIISHIEDAERATIERLDEPDALREFAIRHWDFVTSPVFQTMYQLVNSELTRFPDLSRFYGEEVIHRSLRLIAALLERGMEKGELRRMDPIAAGRIFASMFVSHAVWFSRRDHFGTFPKQSSESVRDTLVDFFLQAMAVPAPTSLPSR